MNSVRIVSALLCLCTTAFAQDRLLWKGEYHDSADIVEIDDKTQVALVKLKGKDALEKIPLRSIPKGMVEQFRGSVQELRNKMLADPKKPIVINGEVLSRISDDAVLVSCKELLEGVPSASGIVCIRGVDAKMYVDGDPIMVGGTPDGEFSYVAAGGAKKVVRAYKRIIPKSEMPR